MRINSCKKYRKSMLNCQFMNQSKQKPSKNTSLNKFKCFMIRSACSKANNVWLHLSGSMTTSKMSMKKVLKMSMSISRNTRKLESHLSDSVLKPWTKNWRIFAKICWISLILEMKSSKKEWMSVTPKLRKAHQTMLWVPLRTKSKR